MSGLLVLSDRREAMSTARSLGGRGWGSFLSIFVILSREPPEEQVRLSHNPLVTEAGNSLNRGLHNTQEATSSQCMGPPETEV